MVTIKKKNKTSYEYYDDAHNTLSIEHIIHAPIESTLNGILTSLIDQFEKHNESYEEGTLNQEIKSCLDEITHIMLRIQDHGIDGIPADTIVILFFRLGIAIGRQEGLGYLAPLVRKLSDLVVDEVLNAKSGPIKGSEKTSVKFSYPTRLAKNLIPRYAMKYPQRLNFEKIVRGVKAELIRLVNDEFDLEIYREETGKHQRPTHQVIEKRVNEALTDLGYQK
jgi:hypothetical protein